MIEPATSPSFLRINSVITIMAYEIETDYKLGFCKIKSYLRIVSILMGENIVHA